MRICPCFPSTYAALLKLNGVTLWFNSNRVCKNITGGQRVRERGGGRWRQYGRDECYSPRCPCDALHCMLLKEPFPHRFCLLVWPPRHLTRGLARSGKLVLVDLRDSTWALRVWKLRQVWFQRWNAIELLITLCGTENDSSSLAKEILTCSVGWTVDERKFRFTKCSQSCIVDDVGILNSISKYRRCCWWNCTGDSYGGNLHDA